MPLCAPYSIPRQDLRQPRKLSNGRMEAGSGGCHERDREEVVAVLHGDGHQPEATRCGAIQSTTLDFGHESMAAELGDVPRDALPPSEPLGSGASR